MDLADHRQLVGQAGAGLIILGVGALLRYMLINVELPDVLKLGSGMVLSMVLAVAALALRTQPQRRGLRLALAGAAGGIAYLTAYSAYALFNYVALPSTAFALLLLVAIMVGVIAVRERAQSMAVLVMLGDFIAPYFALDKASPLELNGYYLLLSLLVLAMVMLRGWRSLIHLSFLFTLAATLFFGWSNNYYAPQHYNVMLPMLLALTSVHLLMPLLEGAHAGRRAAWLQRVDQGYAWALPLTALALAFQLAPAGDQTALAMALLAGVWALGGIVAHLTRQPVARYLWWVGAMLLMAAVVHLHDLSLPWPLLGMLIASTLYVRAHRLGLQAAQQDWLGLAVLTLAAMHIAENAFGFASQDSRWAYAQRFMLAGLLLGTAWAGHRRGNGFVAIMGWAGGLWGALTLISLLGDLQLNNWPTILFVLGLVASGALYVLRQHAPYIAVPAALAVWLTVSGLAAAAEMSHPWTLLGALCALVGMGLLALVALHDPEEDHSSTVASVVLLLLPLALWPWVNAEGRYWDWRGTAFNLSILMVGVLTSSVIARYRLAKDSSWHQNLAPAMFYVVSGALALRLIAHIGRDTWSIVFEVLALVYLARRIHWAWQDKPDGALTRRYQLMGVLLVALFLQAVCLRQWGPPDELLSMADLRRMSAPVLLSLLWAALGALLAIGGHRLRERSIWSTGAALLVVAAGKIVLLDSGSLGSLPNILAVMSAGGLFLAVSWWAPFPPARPTPPPPPPSKKRDPASVAPRPRPRTPQSAEAAMATARPRTASDTASSKSSDPEWRDTVPMVRREPTSPASDALPQRKRRPAVPIPAPEPPENHLWIWVAATSLLLMVWVGYMSHPGRLDRY
ncbi:DUF2339 domain-containing protein [Ottowia sp.]|uniref:DUF2339 domain-containing protein n=1 Tax=Ottowia sp. TaxID=1898956 RepID=UPI003A84FED8